MLAKFALVLALAFVADANVKKATLPTGHEIQACGETSARLTSPDGEESLAVDFEQKLFEHFKKEFGVGMSFHMEDNSTMTVKVWSPVTEKVATIAINMNTLETTLISVAEFDPSNAVCSSDFSQLSKQQKRDILSAFGWLKDKAIKICDEQLIKFGCKQAACTALAAALEALTTFIPGDYFLWKTACSFALGQVCKSATSSLPKNVCSDIINKVGK